MLFYQLKSIKLIDFTVEISLMKDKSILSAKKIRSLFWMWAKVPHE